MEASGFPRANLTERKVVALMHRMLAACLSVFSLIGCDGTTTEPVISIALDQVPAKFAAAYCATFQRCNPLSYETAFSIDDCAKLVEKQFREQRFDDISKSIAAHKTVYDGVTAAGCVGADGPASAEEPGLLKSEACEYWETEYVPLCERMFAATVEDGGSCDLDAECGVGHRCVATNDTCPGVCTARLALDMPCSRDEDCAEGLVCSNAAKLCTTPPAEGEPCGGGVAAQCGRAHLCIGEDVSKGQTGVCRTELEALVGAEGERCSLAGPYCQEGLSCVVESADGAGALVANCRAKVGSGGDCKIGRPSQCPSGEFCPLPFAALSAGTFSATCETLPADGQPCAPDSSAVRCGAGLRCNANTNRCEALRDRGQSCSTNDLCYSGNCVNGVCASLNRCVK